jgi:hypothetical protein
VITNGVTQHFVQPGLSTYIIGSQTLIAGSPAITVSGTVVSLMPGGSSIVVGGDDGGCGWIYCRECGD